ncbi:hypothetical protein B0H14DRAFT_2556146 [Mycena olivaceomarginata]|nr:hypothetical protein B0H14DRAFT_2556146 [Mycena olivaceomarginata]
MSTPEENKKTGQGRVACCASKSVDDELCNEDVKEFTLRVDVVPNSHANISKGADDNEAGNRRTQANLDGIAKRVVSANVSERVTVVAINQFNLVKCKAREVVFESETLADIRDARYGRGAAQGATILYKIKWTGQSKYTWCKEQQQTRRGAANEQGKSVALLSGIIEVIEER